MFHVPDVQPEHVEKIFKDFDREQVDKIFPPGYFKSELLAPERQQKPAAAAVTVDLENDGEEETENVGKREKGEDKEDKVVEKGPTPSPFGECPLCGDMFAMKELEEHAQDCSQEEPPPPPPPPQNHDLGIFFFF